MFINLNNVICMVMKNENIKILPIEHNSAIERLMDYVPELMEKANMIAEKTMEKKEQKSKVQPVVKNKIIKTVKNIENGEDLKTQEQNADKNEEN